MTRTDWKDAVAEDIRNVCIHYTDDRLQRVQMLVADAEDVCTTRRRKLFSTFF